MIESIRHKGLRQYYEEGKAAKLPANQLSKIRRIFDMLNAVTSEDDIIQLGKNVHSLKGELAGYRALSVTGNYRITFRFEDGGIYDIDYVDYH
jgi:proteic killer suppression protein